jgi:hypothetical protein
MEEAGKFEVHEEAIHFGASRMSELPASVWVISDSFVVRYVRYNVKEQSIEFYKKDAHDLIHEMTIQKKSLRDVHK